MKKTGFHYLFKSIRKNLAAFLNMALIAAVGASVLLGFLSTSKAIQRRADAYFIEQKLQSAEIKCANGITEEDIAALRQHPDVDLAEGAYAARLTMAYQDERLLLQALSLTETLNLPALVEGRLPVAADELAVEQEFADKRNIQVGDTLTLTHDGALLCDVFTVTAVLNLPNYVCVMGNEGRGASEIGMGVVAHYVALSPEAFDRDYYQGCYPLARVRSNALDDCYYYSDEYTEQESILIEKLELFGEERARLRYESLLAQAQPAIDAGLLAPDAIRLNDWTITNREDAGDLLGISILVDTLNSISYAMSALFMLVVAVVCYTSIARMIEEQRALIGMQKALGYRSGEILRHYVLYNALSALLGILLGCLISVFLIQKVMLIVLNPSFLVGDCGMTFVWPEALVVSAVCMAVFLLTSWLTCRKIVQLPAVELMNAGRFQQQNKIHAFEQRHWFQNRRLFTRVMLKNVLGDKKRLITTIIGVLGSVTLMVICFSLDLAIDGAHQRQFDRYFFFENRLIVDSSTGDLAEFEEILTRENVPHLAIQDKLKTFRVPGGKWDGIHFLALDPDTPYDDFLYLENTATGEPLPLPEDGVLINAKTAENHNLSAGSTVEVLDSFGNVQTVRIAGVMEHYVSFRYMVTSTTYYEQVMGQPADRCVFLLEGSADGLLENVQGVDGFLSLTDTSAFKEDTSIIYAVIALCLVLSACMVFLVILSQIAMYIDRKALELAIMRINGYTIAETKAFIYRDNIVLTILGLLIGSGFGLALSGIMIRIMERDVHHYLRTPNPLACLYAGAITVVFVILVNIIGLRHIHTLNLTDVNAN